MTILDFYQKKLHGEKLSLITCYDYSSARILAQTSIDAILVGDSVAMTMYGYKDTIAATVDMMGMHTEAVRRGAPNKFIITDLPFLSYRKSLSQSVTAAQKLMQAGAQALKLENAKGNLSLIRHLVESGVPVMGHLGLSMQAMHMFGGCKVQGRTLESAARIKEDALALQDAGCFALVLECIPKPLATEITKLLGIATIGIGAGNETDGQILVFQDLLGLNVDFKPKFVKNYLNGCEQVKLSIETYINEITTRVYPNDDYSYQS